MQHAPVGDGQLVPAQVVPSPWYTPLNAPAHVVGFSSTQLPSSRQHAPVAGVQSLGVTADRSTQSPLGRQMLGMDWNVVQPCPHTQSVPVTMSIQFAPGSSNPLVSVQGNALNPGSGADRHGLPG